MTNIHATLALLDDDMTRINTIYTSCGPREATFLTEEGLYELLYRSRVPLAKAFRKWVASVLKDIRLTGQYQMQQHLEQAREQREQLKQLAERAEADAEAEREARRAEKRKLEDANADLLDRLHKQSRKQDLVYVMRADPTSHTGNIFKLGSGRSFKTSHVIDPMFVYHKDVDDGLLVEKNAHKFLEAYRIDDKKEFFEAPLDVIISAIEDAAEIKGGLIVEEEEVKETERVGNLEEYVSKYCELGTDVDGHNVPPSQRFRVPVGEGGLYEHYVQHIRPDSVCDRPEAPPSPPLEPATASATGSTSAWSATQSRRCSCGRRSFWRSAACSAARGASRG